jgi:hypothetical protein
MIVGTASAFYNTTLRDPSVLDIDSSAVVVTPNEASGSTGTTFVSEVNEPVSMFNIGENLNSIVNASEVD